MESSMGYEVSRFESQDCTQRGHKQRSRQHKQREKYIIASISCVYSYEKTCRIEA